MKVNFQGDHSTEEAAESIANILKLFKERYGVAHLDKISLQVGLIDEQGESVEIVDAKTQEVYDNFEVLKHMPKKPNIQLVVDNTQN